MFQVTYILLWVVVVFQGLAICFLVQQLAAMRLRANDGQRSSPVSGWPVGSLAPPFSAIDSRTGQLVQSSVFVGRRQTVLFLSAECATCRTLASDLSSLASEALSGLVVYCHGARRRSQILASKLLHHPIHVLWSNEVDIRTEFRFSGLPAIVVIDAEWKIVRSEYAHKVDDVLECLRSGPERMSDDSASDHMRAMVLPRHPQLLTSDAAKP